MERILLLLLLALVARPAFAANAECEAALVPESKPFFVEQLTRTNAQLDQGDVSGAVATLDGATRFPRSADVSVSSRCMGEALSERLFRIQQRMALTAARATEAAGDETLAGVFFVRAGALNEVRRLIADAPDEASAYASVANALAGERDQGPSLGVGGDLPAPAAQRAHWSACTAFADELSERIRGAAVRRLEAERTLMDTPATPEELAAGRDLAQGEATIAALLHRDASAASIPVEALRASRSLDELRAARDLLELAKADAAPVARRANARGDRLETIAQDDTQLLDIRVRTAEWATKYFALSGATERETGATALSERLGTELAVRNADREQELEARQAELDAASSEVERAAIEMEKTKSEKKAFKEEADALEKELGF